MSSGLVITGAGHAGGAAAALLRQYGFAAPITLVGAEPVPPYQRPPLSKGWLTGSVVADGLALRAEDFYRTHDIALRLGETVAAIDRAARVLHLGDGAALAYDRLILALGAWPRALAVPGSDFCGVLELRSVADANRLRAEFFPGRRLAVIGGGYIGLEVAASARTLGLEVTVIEREARVLARVACPSLSRYFEDRHRAQGVGFELGAAVAGIEGAAGRVRAVRLADGRAVRADLVLVGIGGVANDALARNAGLLCDDGILVDLAARSSDASIHAIGDCTQRPLPLYGCTGRLESVPNALEQAKQAAADICDRRPPAPEVPWFWSDQFSIRLQIAGLPIGAVASVVRGDPASDSFAVFHLAADGRVLAVEAVNAPAEFMGGRAMIGRRKCIAAADLRNLSLSMQHLAA